MIHCKPKRATYISLGIVVTILIAGLSYILHDFSSTRSFGLIFYLFSAVLLTVVILLILVKMMAGYRFITAEKDSITLRLPLRGYHRKYPLMNILAWQEDIVITNKKEFRQLTLVFEDKNSCTISNHEHTQYLEFYKYLMKKVPKKKVKA
ncbi:hypothetical protein GCM10007049_36110 [Echinicola pacifica]|uniref:PH domain-containing protein n=1 Tax=Echinicola pacifica TaxID=346377 RepID=A0A918QDJ5_9BACT|nr:hypothetical protein [Echinicola pacifica]GGZ39573.1 hypothetical protein GCM10007049_36110 [Echinicola pacifica]